MKRAYVTGGSGFIGSNLIRRLINEGWLVHIIVRKESNLDCLKNLTEKIVIHYYDKSTQSVINSIENAKPDVVFHLASLFISEHTPQSVSSLVESNILFSTQLVEAMSIMEIKKIINTGTSWQNFNNKSYSPVNLYAATKEAFECILQYYIEVFSFEVVTLRLYDTYGADDKRPKILNLIKKASESGESLAMSPGTQLLDLLHVDDVVNAYIIASERLTKNEVVGHEIYQISSANLITLKDLVEKFCLIAGYKLHIDWGVREYKNREVMIPSYFKNNLPNWKPVITLDAGLLKMTKNYE